MTNAQTGASSSPRPLRLWPGVVAASLLLILGLVVPLVVPDGAIIGVIGGVGCGLAILVWWVVFSRAAWSDRLGAIVLMAIALLAASQVVHRSIANGMMGMMLPLFSIPVAGLAIAASATIGSRFSIRTRRLLMCVAILLAYGSFTLIRTGGVTGDGASDLHWRWTPTPEDRLLAQGSDEPRDAALTPSSTTPATTDTAAPAREEAAAPVTAKTPDTPAVAEPATTPSAPVPGKVAPPADVAMVKASWPGFRGRDRDGVVRGVQIATDWSASPPVQMWRRPIGPGWSSFAIRGDVLYTQEQRGDDEIVAAYHVTTGEPVWRHRDPIRFYESNGGAGPRGTPTLSNGRLYAMGATGMLNALDAATGAVLWSRNAATDTNRRIPDWGIASSPLVIGDLVVAAISGTMVAYDAATGQPRWTGPQHGGSYSSPQLMTIDGVEQIVMLSGAGATSVSPADGALLWEYAWEGTTIVQPAALADDDILISTATATGGTGIRRLALTRNTDGWTVEERWTSNGLKPYFNDYVIHNGHAFGFDGSILACIDLEDGKRAWKNGRYGNGQLVLLPEQDLLLVLSEDGELALVGAKPDAFTEVARFPAIEGKTWNHPVLVGDILLIRNGEEMAAFRLSPASR